MSISESSGNVVSMIGDWFLSLQKESSSLLRSSERLNLSSQHKPEKSIMMKMSKQLAALLREDSWFTPEE
jgi:hypothetical protein